MLWGIDRCGNLIDVKPWRVRGYLPIELQQELYITSYDTAARIMSGCDHGAAIPPFNKQNQSVPKLEDGACDDSLEVYLDFCGDDPPSV